jgi:hypothetical protein
MVVLTQNMITLQWQWKVWKRCCSFGFKILNGESFFGKVGQGYCKGHDHVGFEIGLQAAG